MHYSNEPNHVRVDFFKAGGKWGYTEMAVWPGELWNGKNLIREAFIKVLKQNFPNRFRGLTAVCLEPYHEHTHPLMVHIPEEGWPDE